MAEEDAKSFWPSFSDGNEPSDVDCDFTGGIAKNVLQTFSIPANTNIDGGSLDTIDIKSMDAMTALKLSLLDYSAANGGIWEPITNAEGEVTFVDIGTDDGLADTEVYYEIQTGTFTEECSGVMITARRPMAQRHKAAFKPIWQGGSKDVFTSGWLASSCLSKKYSAYATIVFTDPQLDTQYEDGIDNFYDIKSPWENLIGYARYISWPNQGSADSSKTDVRRSSQAKVPILISGNENTDTYRADLGNLQARPSMPKELDISPGCFADSMTDAKYSDGVKVDIPDSFRFQSIRGDQVDKFIGVSAVYIVGRKIDDLKAVPRQDSNAVVNNPSDSDCKAKASIESPQDSIFKLSEGIHYQIAYNDDNPAIVFASNGRNFDPKEYGANTTIYIDEHCAFYKETQQETYTGSVLPVGGSQGYLVAQVWVIVDLNTPSIIVYDPRVEQQKALEIANDLTFELAPLISTEEPAPVAYAGKSFQKLINLEQMQKDHDPKTQQNFYETDYETALRDMDQGGGMTLSMSFLDAGEALSLAKTLYNYMNTSNGSITTYICGPDSEPVLGGRGQDDDSIVNEIVYSYQDSNSYTISVTCGQKLIGDFAQIDGGPTYKMTEEVSARGTITQDQGDHAIFKVYLDGYGPVTAINCCPEVLRVGDKVQVTVHNNPVEG